MAIGFTPKHIEYLYLDGLTPKEILVLLNETAIQVRWTVDYISNNGIIAYTNKGMFSWNAEIKIEIENGALKIQSESTGSEMMDWGKNKKNVANFISQLNEIKLTLTKEELDTEYQKFKDHIVSDEEDILKLPPATATAQIKDFFSIFIPKQGFYITAILLDLNIFIFILMAISGVNIMLPDNESLVLWGANFRPMTLEGDWWRLLTNCFLHIGIFHLLMNMYALLYIGVLLEPHLGKARFITAYLLTGITASIASLWWHDLTISAGASGAIFGMYGVFLAMLTTNLIEKRSRKTLLTSIAVFVAYNLLYGLKGGTDNAAHIGGLLGGIVIGYAFIPSLKKPDNNTLRFGTIGLMAILITASSFVAYKKLPYDIAAYDAKMKEFATMESMALDIYNITQELPKDEILYEIKDRGIYYWKENLKLVDSFERLQLPRVLQKRNQILREYCELRIKSYELLYKAISEDNKTYGGQIDDYHKQITAIIDELGNGKPTK